MPSTIETAEDILKREFTPQHLEIIDESHLHAGHMGYIEGQSTHLKIIIVSDQFESIPMIRQHRLINESLKELMGNPIHALSLKTIKPSKWNAG